MTVAPTEQSHRSITERLWPKLDASPNRDRASQAALWSAVGAALVVPLTKPGLGWALAAVGLVAVFAVAGPGAGAGPARPATDRAARIVAGVAAVALVAVGSLRAASWLFAICVLVAFALGSFAVVGGRSWRDLAVVAVILPWSALMAADEWPKDGRPSGSRSGWRTLRALAVSAALLAVFGALFSAADPAFKRIIAKATPSVTVERVLQSAVVFALFSVLAIGIAFARSRRAELVPTSHPEPKRRFGQLDWAIPVALLDLLFSVFVGVQIDVLFAGNAYILGPNGPDYADYARNGFGQLMVVTVLTLAIIAAAARFAPRARAQDRLLLRLLVGILCLLTLVIVASAVQRMRLYVDAYGFTRLRLFGDAIEIWLGLIFILILGAGVRLRADWLPRAAVAAGVAVLFALVAINPDAYIARTVIARYEKDGHLDWNYLYGLSSDAVPEMVKLPASERPECLISHAVWADGRGHDPWYAYNFGRAQARDFNSEPDRCSFDRDNPFGGG